MGAISNTVAGNTFYFQIENNGSWQWEISEQGVHLYLKLSGPTEHENHWYHELKSGESFEGAIWSYPKKQFSDDGVVVNMVNPMLQRSICRDRFGTKPKAEWSSSKRNIEQDTVVIPVNSEKGNAKVIYPKKNDCTLAATKETLTVTLKNPNTAVIIELA